MNTIPNAVMDHHMHEMILSLTLSQEELADPTVCEFLELTLRTKAEEKVSSPDDWTAEQTAAYGSGNWRLFSQLRGYTEQEIATFARFIEVVCLVDDNHGDPSDKFLLPQSMSFQMQQCLEVVAEAAFPDLPWEDVEKQLYAAAADNVRAAFIRVAQGK